MKKQTLTFAFLEERWGNRRLRCHNDGSKSLWSPGIRFRSRDLHTFEVSYFQLLVATVHRDGSVHTFARILPVLNAVLPPCLGIAWVAGRAQWHNPTRGSYTWWIPWHTGDHLDYPSGGLYAHYDRISPVVSA